MIELAVPVEQIPYIRTIEGRRFHNGKWQFPDTALHKLINIGLIPSDTKPKEKEVIQYNLSPFLREYQKKIVNSALNSGCYGIFSDTGTGKTIMGLEIADHYKKNLILCPLSTIETAWIDDCHNFYPHRNIVNVWGTSKVQRLKKLNTQADIYVMNYESYKILRNEIREAGFDCVIVDESSVMKNMSSQITSMLLDLTSLISHRFVLSGCPTPNHNSEIFPQMKFVDSDLFGNNFYGFLARYFHQDMTNPHNWYQTDEDKERYYAKLSNKSVFLRKEDCVDLPEKVFEVRKFQMSKKQKEYYDSLYLDIQSNINHWSKFEFTAKLMKLREVASGFVINKDKSITTFDNGKEQLLYDVISEIGNKPIIIWCQFKHEIETLAKKFNGVALTSQTKNRDSIIRDFKDNKIQLLFTHPKLIGKGLTFTNCTYNIYYSLSFSYEEFKQSQDRIHRIGQNKKCTYIILQADNTIEKKMYDCVQRKGNAVDELYLEMGLK
ncbi:MAG: DEAD/DEAH box helicase [Bacteroidales bacterium]|nr:DEAD/DEAH box helicase [Bacteroidales bacterium]